MTYIEKMKQLLDKIREDGYSQWDGDARQACQDIEDVMMNFVSYADIVIRQQMETPMHGLTDEREDYVNFVEGIDSRRTSIHDTAIGSVNILNRLCAKNGLPPFADIDTTNRVKVADFIGEFMDETYHLGAGSAAFAKKS